MAALLTVARFCAQRSELGVAEHWHDTTALDDLLGIDTAGKGFRGPPYIPDYLETRAPGSPPKQGK